MDTINDTQSILSTTSWLWLFPMTYVVHIAEEYWGGEGYSAYLLRLRGVQLSPARFLAVQAMGLALVVAGVVISRQLKFPEYMRIILGALVLSNVITDTISACWVCG